MSVSAALPELEDMMEQGSCARRAEMLSRIADLFAQGAAHFNDDHVRLFDDVFGRMIGEVDAKARSELSHRLASIRNAPKETVARLAADDAIAVARAVLNRSPRIDQNNLIDIAQNKSQAHLLAISERSGLTEPVTDILVGRGGHELLRKLAANLDARLSDASFLTLVESAAADHLLAEKVGLRPDIPPRLFRDLLLQTTELVQQRLLASSKPEMQSEIRRVLADAVKATTRPPRDYGAAERQVHDLEREGKLDEAVVLEFAADKRHEQTVAALAALCAVPIDIVDRLMDGDRPDPILILSKSVGWGWQTVKAILELRPRAHAMSDPALDAAYANFDRLSPTTAQRVMRFWQVQQWQQNAAPD